MPIYEYVCETCGEDFEVIRKFSDPPLKRHTCAPKSKVRRKLSLNAFQLKGGGWYNEGYARGDAAGNGGNGAAASDNSAGDSSSNGASGKDASGDGGAAASAASGKDGKSESGSSSKGESKTASKPKDQSSKSGSGSSPASTQS